MSEEITPTITPDKVVVHQQACSTADEVSAILKEFEARHEKDARGDDMSEGRAIIAIGKVLNRLPQTSRKFVLKHLAEKHGANHITWDDALDTMTDSVGKLVKLMERVKAGR